MAHEKARGRYTVRIHKAKDRTTNMVSLGCFAQHALKITRTFQTVAGVLCAVLCIVGIALKAYYSSYAWSLFAGLLIFIFTGIVAAIHNERLYSKPIERVYIVMSFISAIYSAIMMIIAGVKANPMSFSYSCYKLYDYDCGKDLFGQTIADILLSFLFWVEIGCGMMGGTVGYWASRRFENVQEECPQTSGKTPSEEKNKITGTSTECDTLRMSGEHATVIIHKDEDENDMENDIANDIVIEGTNDESTLQATALVKDHDKNKKEAEMKSRDGSGYMSLTGYDGSEYEGLKFAPYDDVETVMYDDVQTVTYDDVETVTYDDVETVTYENDALKIGPNSGLRKTEYPTGQDNV